MLTSSTYLDYLYIFLLRSYVVDNLFVIDKLNIHSDTKRHNPEEYSRARVDEDDSTGHLEFFQQNQKIFFNIFLFPVFFSL